MKKGIAAELPNWRLSTWHLPLMLVWAAWPWLCGWMFPQAHAIAWLPVILLAPLIYPGVVAFMAIFPGWAPAFPIGLSLTLFGLAYLAVVVCRHARLREMKRASPKKLF